MTTPSAPTSGSLDPGAVADLSHYRTVAVTGGDAEGWLNDLVSADIAGLSPRMAARALLLAPTGGVLATFTVTTFEDRLLLIQDPAEPRAIDQQLGRYILSSDVRLIDTTGTIAIFAFPGTVTPPDLLGATPSTPSVLGVGSDLLSTGDRAEVAAALTSSHRLLTPEQLESWRIVSGLARIGIDTEDTDLPGEIGLLDAVAFDKGCFVGQEAVAKVRRAGHPRRLLLPLATDRPRVPPAPGDPVFAGDDVAGAVTSAATDGERTVLLARVAWKHGTADLSTTDGDRLHAVT